MKDKNKDIFKQDKVEQQEPSVAKLIAAVGIVVFVAGCLFLAAQIFLPS